MNNKIYHFDKAENFILSQVGGKGKALIETSKAGFPVPGGFVLAVEFFKPWLKDIKSSDEWKKLLLDTKKESCDLVKKKAENLTFTDNQHKSIKEALKEFNKDTIFAVRSSSPEEDLEGTSFAGMYETYLGVTLNMLEKSVAAAFSSCFDFRVMEYKKQNKINLENTSIAVVVQRQIASDVSGVGFSLNPSNNCYDEVMINASFGLGESIVSGIVTPDAYVVDTVDEKIIEKKIGEKENALWLKEDGGTTQKKVDDPKKQALTDKEILELSHLIKKCEEHYGKPMDTEWAFEKGKLYLLQSRPITTYIPLFPEIVTEKGERKKIYVDMMIMTQGFSESMSVLGIELWSKVVYVIKNGLINPAADGVAPALHGRQYINVSGMLKSWGKATTNKFLNGYDENLNKIFKEIDLSQYKLDKKPESLKGSKRAMAGMVFKMIPSAAKAKFSNYRDAIKDYNKMAEEIFAHLRELKLDKDFDKIVESLMKDTYIAMTTFGVVMAGMGAFTAIKKMFKGKDVDNEIVALGMDLEGNPTSEMGYMLFELASFNEFQNTKSGEEFVNKIKKRAYSKEFMELYDEYIKKFGARGFMEIDVASKRVYEDPYLLYEKLVNININDSQITKVKEKRLEAYNKLLKIAKENGFQKKFKRQSDIYQATFGYREHPKYIIVMICSKIHELLLELGEKLVKEGKLDEKYHIFDLHIKEITVAQKGENIDLRAIREKNLEPYKKVENVKNWPLVIDSRGKIYNAKIDPKKGDLVGSAIAPGVVRGKAKVLKTPYEKPLNPGEILVTKATEPSWTPIFINAAGVIMEIGGPLQHGGIIAREYGIPCVSGMMGIMDVVKDGDMLEVDGNNGIVKIIKE
ncbi:PEP/pyruvate-binding domain-containing protein [Clostridium oceanicum]|uniref:Phosphoenolpyruvate synthase n=1 Tax=Clostridium oceanicum TaxID=1543 RepID=A0ABP3UT23_9CLOT